MRSDGYPRKVVENKKVLKSLFVDLDSWDGAEKKELQLKLKECSHLLKEWNVSAVNYTTLAFARQFMDKIQGMENEARMKMKINASLEILRRIEDRNQFMKSTAKYNENILNSEKNELKNASSDALQQLPLDLAESSAIFEYGGFPFQQIKDHLKKIKEQEVEIEKLSSFMKTL